MNDSTQAQVNVGPPHPPERIPQAIRVLLVLLRGLAAAFIGIELGAVLAADLGLDKSFDVVVLVAVMLVCVAFGRNRLLILLALLIIGYAVSLVYSNHKVSSFCASVTPSTKPTDLLSLAEQAHVEFRVFPIKERPGEFYGLVCDPFTICEHNCSFEYDSSRITSIGPRSH